ncbi:MAG TPA: type II secretion system protein [Telluria sp.]
MGGRAHRQQAGFTYIGLIVFVTIIGLVGAATLKVGALLQRAEAENELLEIGAEFSAALRSYALATPKGQPMQPTSLEALLRDPRFPNPRRHLRRIFVDPITGKAEWGLLAPAEGGPILGVYSLSQAQPLKIANFDARFVNFENKKHLSDWKFMAGGQRMSTPAAATPRAAASPNVTMFPQSPDIPNAPAAAPVQEQQVLRELEPPPKNEPVEPEPREEDKPPATAEPVEDEKDEKDEKDETTERKPEQDTNR